MQNNAQQTHGSETKTKEIKRKRKKERKNLKHDRFDLTAMLTITMHGNITIGESVFIVGVHV